MPMKWRRPNFALGGRADEQHFAVLVDEAVVDQVRRIGSALRSKGGRPFHSPGQSWLPIRRFLQAQREELLRDDVPGLRRRDDRLDERLAPQVQQPGGPQQRFAVDARGTGSSWWLPGRRPVRPIRCRNAATVGGQLTWITRSRSPTSMPSSSVDVETMTQSRASANACSERCRSSADRDACDRNA